MARGSPWPCLAPAPAVSPLAGGQHRRQLLVGSRAMLGGEGCRKLLCTSVCTCKEWGKDGAAPTLPEYRWSCRSLSVALHRAGGAVGMLQAPTLGMESIPKGMGCL